MTKKLFWLWLLVLIVVNLIPIGNDTNQSLSRNRLWVFRLDYLAHAIMILCFALIRIWGALHNVRWFKRCDALKYSAIVLASGVCLELLQLGVPWRSFNPTDMIYNLGGAVLAIVFIMLSESYRRA
ncbi:MAG: VanZ family protein [Candidatus Cloacimonetes bacterium]|nr:VanZ family protein [Candidatus Cloacimonadota bacterium]